MNIDTGKIVDRKDIPEGKEDDFLPADTQEMTPKQKQQGFVHPKDSRSVLGKRRVAYVNMTRNQRKRLRKKLQKRYGA